MLKDRRRGRFKIAVEFINSERYAVQMILSEVIVVETHISLMDEIVHYAGISPHFREIEFGGVTPEYEVEFTSHTGEVKFTEI